MNPSAPDERRTATSEARSWDGRGSRVVVVKVGGSLLGWPGLPGRLGAYLAERAEADERLVLIAGGGAFADSVRELDRTHGLGPERSDALALRTMDLSAFVLEALVPGSVVVDRLDQLDRTWSEGKTPVFSPRPWLDEDDRSARDPRPLGWDVTSDAIAARLSDRLGAAELVLLKSASPPPGLDRLGASEIGLVDPFFPEAARRLPIVSVLNLREDGGVPHRLG